METDMITMELQKHEAVIERGLNTFVEVGQALLEIRDSRLYRLEYSTFEDYCRDRWGIIKRYANRLIQAANIIENLGPMGPILPATERQARPLSALEPAQQSEAWQRVVDTAPEGKITAAYVQQVVNEFKRPVSYHVSDDSYDWYTPLEYIQAARGVMGRIDLDPASSDAAQAGIQASAYYTREIDGLSQPWSGNVWLNPPYNMPLIEQFTQRVIDDFEAGIINQAMVLTNNSTDTAWFHRLLRFPVCFTRGRIKFINGDDTLATRQGQAIFYLGDKMDLFARVFTVFGEVMRRYDDK